jgi:hypothetical protein
VTAFSNRELGVTLCFSGLPLEGECLTSDEISTPLVNLHFFLGVWNGEPVKLASVATS